MWIQVPRERAGSFTPQIVPNHTRRLDGFNEAIGLAARESPDDRRDLSASDGHVRRRRVSRVDQPGHRQRPRGRSSTESAHSPNAINSRASSTNSHSRNDSSISS
ncbi:hypothetical protein [Micromonospora sp. NPDC057141]|uniref:hypothetical protein n=1 Tax=Micromonospora sp. NPDC057141 TaxID=3346033 RepID=UPI00362B883C